MKRLSLFLAAVSAVTLTSRAQTNNPSALERFAKPSDALVAAALDAGGSDNVTVVVVDL